MKKNPSDLSSLDEVLAPYYRAWFRYHPEAAVDCGVEGYAHLLTPCDADSAGALICLNDEMLVALDELAGASLTHAEQLDLRLVRAAAAIENQRLLDVDPRRVDPARWLPLDALYQLTIRPVADFSGALMARLAAVPEHLTAARDHLVPRAPFVPAIWLESAVMSAREGVQFVRVLAACPKFGAHPPAGLEAAIERAAQALSEFAAFLERDIAPQAAGEVACGQSHFEHLLHARHFLEVGVDELRAFGEALAARTRAELKAVCRELNGSEDIGAMLARVRAAALPAGELLMHYRNGMNAARAFVASRSLLTLPAGEMLEVVDTPAFLRHQIPFAAYCDPSPADPAQHGLYYVTPPASEAERAEHDAVGLMHTCVHEAWPGHHLQFVTANRSPSSHTLPRLLHASATLYEGWALYCEQLMHEQGFLDRPESRFVLLRDRLWRALRVLIDIDLHTGRATVEQAAERLTRELGFAPAQARAEITWYSRAPTVPLGYATGWALINATRNRWQEDNPGAALREFHDRLLSVGSVALPLVIEHAFGEATWTVAREQVLET